MLVTTPAWSQVRAAIDNLALLGQGTGNPISIAENCRCIEDFAEILKQGSDAVLALLRCAALLSGVGDAATPALRLGHTVKSSSAYSVGSGSLITSLTSITSGASPTPGAVEASAAISQARCQPGTSMIQ